MAATKSNLHKIINTRKEKHNKGKRKTFKSNILQFDPYYPYVTSKRVKALYKYNDINSFWRYSPVNPFSLRKYEEESDDDNPRFVTDSTASTPSENKQRASPKLNTVASAGNMSSLLSRRENDNSAAVIEARREIEKIKSELETLINSNIKAQVTHTESTNLIPPELPEIETLLDTAADACNTLADKPGVIEIEPEPFKSNAPEPVIKTTVLFHSPTRRKIVPLSIEEPPPPLEQIRPKSRSYDPEKTREFIKKQKLRRKEKLLEEEQEKQQKEFARKIKLEELKKKTIELVSKNLKKTTVKSAKTPSDLNTNNTTKSIDNNKTVNKFLLQSRRCRARSFDNSKRDVETDTKRSRSVSREININQSKQNIPENQTLVGAKSQASLRSSSQKSLSPKTTIKPLEKKEPTKIDIPSKMIEINEINEKTSLSTKEHIKTVSPPPNTKQKILSINITSNNEILPSPTTKTTEEYESNAAKELTEIKQKLETSITQIKDKNEIPIWLQPPSSVPYPYNFISAVRKKLEYVTRKPNKIDKNDENNKLNVSVQCTLDKKKSNISKDKKILDVNSVNIPKLKSPLKLESPKNRTYESHKCRRQLYPNINIPQKKSIEMKTNEIEININKTDSDSDTTKNIPELPHEETVQPVKHKTKFEETKKNITFDKSKDIFSRDSSKFSLASDISERVKNITFERNIPSKLNVGNIKLPEPEKYPALVPPEDKIEIPKSRKTRSKYPEDIDSILSHYSKIKSEHNSYSDDFNSVSGSASSKPEKTSITESITEYKQIPSGFVSVSKSGTISEHLAPRTNTNSSSKENIFEENSRKTKSRVSTETNLTMKDVPSLSSKQTDSVAEVTTIKTESDLIKTDPSTIRTASSIHLKHKEREEKSVDVPPLKKLTKPEVFLKRRSDEIENNPNHIHLKLQAEVHLLNSFNNSLKQVVAVEKSVFDVPSTSHFNPINCKRGCDYPENNVFNKSDSKFKNNSNTSFKSFKNNSNSVVGVNDDDDESVCSKDLGMSNIIDRSSISTTVATNSIISRREENLDLKSHPYISISLDMVDQMIKDEDIRLEHLKAVLKLRDQALFDRIKGELALLEIRKRELREHGQTNDITAIKKKQRGLIIKLQQERHEMHRLKTAHKQAAKARKSALHEQKSIIKTQLSSTDQIPKKLRRLSHLERPSLGPVKVYRVDSRTEVSETTVSRKGSDDSVTNSSVLTQISEKISVEKSEIFYSDSLAVVETSIQKNKQSSLQSDKLKRSLLMKEAEIDKRRKEIEELIKWQKRLKQKEAEVVELERQAVKSLQSDDQGNVRVFTGAHLNKVWKGIALPDKNFDEHKKYQMSKRSLDKFYQNARKMFREVSDEERRSKTESYSSEFEPSNCTSRLDLSNSVASLNDVDVDVDVDVAQLRHISDIISVPDDVDKSVSASESPSVKTEVNTLIKSDSIHSEFPDSLQNKSQPTKSLELIIASEYSNRKPDESTSVASEILKTDSLEKSPSEHLIASGKSNVLSPASRIEEKLHSTSIQTDIVSEVSGKSQPQVSENIDSLNTSAKSDYISKSISEAPEKSEHQFEEKIISGNSSAKSISDVKTIPEVSEKYEPHILENIPSKDSSVKSDSEIRSINEATDKSEENIVSEDINISKSVHEVSQNQIEENIVSGNSSAYSHSDVRTIPEASEKYELHVLENTPSKDSSVKSKSEIRSATDKSESPTEENIVSEDTNISKSVQEASVNQIEENIVSRNSSAYSHSDVRTIPEASEQSNGHIQEITDTRNSSAESITEPEKPSEKSELQIPDSIDSSIKSESIPDAADKSELPIQEQSESLNSSAKSEINTFEYKSSPELEESDHQIEENTDSHNSSNKSETDTPQVQEIIVSETSENDGYISPEKSTTPAQESNKIESWEPQIISDIKSESSEKEIETNEIKSEIEANSIYPEKSSNTQSIVESKIFDELESKSKTNSETHEQYEIDTATPRSAEVHYETDFDKFSESDQSKIETESNVSLKETNVDSSINEDEPEEIAKSEASNIVTSESLSETIKVSPKDTESKNISEKSETAEILDDEDVLNDSKKGVSHIDVRKRVSEILADANANGPRGDKSPRVQDLYTTTYDIPGSSESTPESGSPTNEFAKQEKAPSFSSETPYINEAEELLRKQLEIEQEIKRLERQQQNIPYLFMREIPNKPPPPYKPPDFPLTPVVASIIPSKPEQTKKMINDAANVLYDAYACGDLMNTSSGSKDHQQRFMFDLCKEIATEACKPTIETKQPSWRNHKNKFQNMFARRPITKDRLNSVLNKKVLQLLNFEPVARNDSLIIRWSRKKRDHVDEILVSETQAEEAEWTNFDSDEEVIKDNLTQNILDLLIVEAAKDFNDILNKKKSMSTEHC